MKKIEVLEQEIENIKAQANAEVGRRTGQIEVLREMTPEQYKEITKTAEEKQAEKIAKEINKKKDKR